MKNKFVTAVTAASLLATIFGSSVVARSTVVTAGLDPALTTVDAHGDFVNYDEDMGFSAYSDNMDVDGSNDYSFVLNFEAVDNGQSEAVTGALDLKAVSSNSDILVALTDNADATDTCAEVTDFFALSDKQDDLTADVDGDYTVCVAPAEADTAAKGTIKVYAGLPTAGAASYTLMATLNVTVMGPLASLAVSIADGYKYLAEGNDELAGWLKIVGKDAAGTVLNGDSGTPSDGDDLITGNGTVTSIVEPTTGNSKHYDNTAVTFFDDADVPESYDDVYNPAVDTSDALQYYPILENVCKAKAGAYLAGDAGKTLSLKLKATNGDASTVTSNAISITCTGTSAAAKVAGITASVVTSTTDGVTPVDADGADLTFKIVGEITDSAGRPMGDGADSQDYDFSCVSGACVTAGIINLTDNGTQVAVGGKVNLADVALDDVTRFGKFTYTVKVADSNLATTTAVKKTAVLSYTATNPMTISRVLNKLSTSATITADLGDAAAGAPVTFVVESSTGAISTFTRTANDDGVAVLVLARRKTTVYVQAGEKQYWTGAPTNDWDAFNNATSQISISFK